MKFVSPSTEHYILKFLIPSSHPVLAQNVTGILICLLLIFHLVNFRNTEIPNKFDTSYLKRHRGLRTAPIRAAHRAEKLYIAGAITDYRYEEWRRILVRY